GLAGCEGGAADDVGGRGGEGGQGGRRCAWHMVDGAPGSPEPGTLARDHAGRAGRGVLPAGHGVLRLRRPQRRGSGPALRDGGQGAQPQRGRPSRAHPGLRAGRGWC
ncbi:unnamed protein product, partial [Ectocarpus fasciculatus]